jgi:exodeoxyribonuclease-3
MPASLKVATWNINSVRLRRPIVERLLQEEAPDVLCLQETKCQDIHFPAHAFRDIGYPYAALNGGRGGYHGVAILSRTPLLDVHPRGFCEKENDPRHISAVVHLGSEPVRIHNFYVPAGGDEPDTAVNPKFAHKLAFLQEMTDWLPTASAGIPDIVVGDLNVAPYEHDVWSSKALNRVVSHTPVERAAMQGLVAAGGWIDLARAFVPEAEKLYSWWSYRAKDWRATNKGRRLDHVWAHPALAARAAGFKIMKDVRDWTQPSDHVPVVATFAG